MHEAVTFGGIGAEIAAQIQEEAFDYLDAPVLRLGAPFSPVPFSPVLERAYIPDSNRIAAGVQPSARAHRGLTWPSRSCSPSSG